MSPSTFLLVKVLPVSVKVHAVVATVATAKLTTTAAGALFGAALAILL